MLRHTPGQTAVLSIFEEAGPAISSPKTKRGECREADGAIEPPSDVGKFDRNALTLHPARSPNSEPLMRWR
jgi:hypothetical protein